jgi:hypothetical protein
MIGNMIQLAKYLDFLPADAQIAIERIRKESREPISIVSGIHWAIHHFDVEEKLGTLIVIELNKILHSLHLSPHSLVLINSVAALTLTPDACYDECFGDWTDYPVIKTMVPVMEIKLGRPMFLRQPPHLNVVKPKLWKRLQQDSYYQKLRKNKSNGNKR